MSKIARFFQKVFASNYAATPTGQICQFGSLAGGTAVYSGDPATIQSLPAWLNGWNSATVGSKSPTFQDFNAYQFVVTQQLAYLLQAGIPEYDASTTYYIGSYCQVAGAVYVSIVDSNTGNSVANPSYFSTLKAYLGYATVATTGAYADLTGKPDTRGQAIASAGFSATGGVVTMIGTGFNLTITRLSTGVFTGTFGSAQSNANYRAIITASNGAYSYINQSGSGLTPVSPTTNAFTFTISNGATVMDSPTINVVVFPN